MSQIKASFKIPQSPYDGDTFAICIVPNTDYANYSDTSYVLNNYQDEGVKTKVYYNGNLYQPNDIIVITVDGHCSKRVEQYFTYIKMIDTWICYWQMLPCIEKSFEPTTVTIHFCVFYVEEFGDFDVSGNIMTEQQLLNIFHHTPMSGSSYYGNHIAELYEETFNVFVGDFFSKEYTYQELLDIFSDSVSTTTITKDKYTYFPPSYEIFDIFTANNIYIDKYGISNPLVECPDGQLYSYKSENLYEEDYEQFNYGMELGYAYRDSKLYSTGEVTLTKDIITNYDDTIYMYILYHMDKYYDLYKTNVIQHDNHIIYEYDPLDRYNVSINDVNEDIKYPHKIITPKVEFYIRYNYDCNVYYPNIVNLSSDCNYGIVGYQHTRERTDLALDTDLKWIFCNHFIFTEWLKNSNTYGPKFINYDIHTDSNTCSYTVNGVRYSYPRPNNIYSATTNGQYVHFYIGATNKITPNPVDTFFVTDGTYNSFYFDSKEVFENKYSHIPLRNWNLSTFALCRYGRWLDVTIQENLDPKLTYTNYSPNSTYPYDWSRYRWVFTPHVILVEDTFIDIGEEESTWFNEFSISFPNSNEIVGHFYTANNNEIPLDYKKYTIADIYNAYYVDASGTNFFNHVCSYDVEGILRPYLCHESIDFIDDDLTKSLYKYLEDNNYNKYPLSLLYSYVNNSFYAPPSVAYNTLHEYMGESFLDYCHFAIDLYTATEPLVIESHFENFSIEDEYIRRPLKILLKSYNTSEVEANIPIYELTKVITRSYTLPHRIKNNFFNRISFNLDKLNYQLLFSTSEKYNYGYASQPLNFYKMNYMSTYSEEEHESDVFWFYNADDRYISYPKGGGNVTNFYLIQKDIMNIVKNHCDNIISSSTKYGDFFQNIPVYNVKGSNTFSGGVFKTPKQYESYPEPIIAAPEIEDVYDDSPGTIKGRILHYWNLQQAEKDNIENVSEITLEKYINLLRHYSSRYLDNILDEHYASQNAIATEALRFWDVSINHAQCAAREDMTWAWKDLRDSNLSVPPGHIKGTSNTLRYKPRCFNDIDRSPDFSLIEDFWAAASDDGSPLPDDLYEYYSFKYKYNSDCLTIDRKHSYGYGSRNPNGGYLKKVYFYKVYHNYPYPTDPLPDDGWGLHFDLVHTQGPLWSFSSLISPAMTDEIDEWKRYIHKHNTGANGGVTSNIKSAYVGPPHTYDELSLQYLTPLNIVTQGEMLQWIGTWSYNIDIIEAVGGHVDSLGGISARQYSDNVVMNKWYRMHNNSKSATKVIPYFVERSPSKVYDELYYWRHYLSLFSYTESFNIKSLHINSYYRLTNNNADTILRSWLQYYYTFYEYSSSREKINKNFIKFDTNLDIPNKDIAYYGLYNENERTEYTVHAMNASEADEIIYNFFENNRISFDFTVKGETHIFIYKYCLKNNEHYV